MQFRLICSVALLFTFTSGTGASAQSLDKSDDASMSESLDQNVIALQKSMDDAKKANPAFFKKWEQSRKFNLSYRPTGSPSALGGKGSTQPTVATQPTPPKAPSYTYLFKNQNDLSSCGGLIVALRRDMSDLGLSNGCPKPFDANGVKGALLSYGGDAVKHNDTWTAQGLGALLYSTDFHPDKLDPAYQLQNMNFGLYGSTNTILNSAKSLIKNNTQVYTYGILGAVAFEPPHFIGLYHNFNFSAGGVSNDITNVIAYNETIQYTPSWEQYWIDYPIPIGSLPLTAQFDPSLLLQFDQAGAHSKADRLAFNNQFNSTRVGPQLILSLTPNTSANTPFIEFKRLSASISYHWAYETIGDRALPLFTANVSYTLDDAKHFQLSASYQRGYDENTGIYMNQYLVGLTGKL
jgi:hypothetical protein